MTSDAGTWLQRMRGSWSIWLPQGGCYYIKVTKAVGRAWGAGQDLGVWVDIGQHTNGCQDQDIPSQATPVQDLVTNSWELSMSFRVHGRVQALPGLTCSPEQTPPVALVNPT